jgi:Holliday junction resolvase
VERRITEEQATKAFLDWLELSGWEIICFDFPQSGTGISLHPNESIRTGKNKAAFIPDIVAIKNDVVVFFENKNKFVLNDFIKVQTLRQNNNYSNSITRLLMNFKYSRIFYGVGLVHSSSIEQKINKQKDKIDFAIFSHLNNNIQIFYDPHEIFK